VTPTPANILLAILAAVLAWLTARTFTPHLREAALRCGVVDRPDGRLKQQQAPVPYLGGLAVALGVLVALGVTFRFDRDALAVLLSGAIVLILGLVDDLGPLTPRVKLAGQVLATLVLARAGVRIQLVFLPDWIELPLTVVWMVAVTNAFNLIDVMDGLSSGVGAVAALFLGGVALWTGFTTTGFLGAALAGALWGFRRFNVAPAQIYLGDAGSLFGGFLLGAMAMVNRWTSVHELGAVVPALILGVPLFDMLFVMYIRWRRGLPVMLGSPDHVALRLRKWRLSTRATVRLNLGASAVLGAWGVAVMLAPLPWAIGLLAALVATTVGLAIWLRTIDMTL
jgi:UDP-GlcNAc:undecaprenyl-phosphate GlcNAc-1-phosphate transferase